MNPYNPFVCVESCRKFFFEKFPTMKIVSPTRYMQDMVEPIPASKLRFSDNAEGIDAKGKIGHFFQHDLTKEGEMEKITQETISKLKETLNSYFDDFKEKDLHLMFFRIKECEILIMKRLFHLNNKISNETELRYAITDPIMDLVCEVFKCKVHLEMTIKPEIEVCKESSDIEMVVTTPTKNKEILPSRTPARLTNVPTTSNSCLDYTLYLLQNHNKEIVALIIEAKMNNMSNHVIAQVLGYATRLLAIFVKDIKRSSPAVVIMTESKFYVIILPFITSESHTPLANAVLFGPYDVFRSDCILQEVICLILLLSGSKIRHDVTYSDIRPTVMDDIIKKVEIESNYVEVLEIELKEVRDELTQLVQSHSETCEELSKVREQLAQTLMELEENKEPKRKISKKQ